MLAPVPLNENFNFCIAKNIFLKNLTILIKCFKNQSNCATLRLSGINKIQRCVQMGSIFHSARAIIILASVFPFSHARLFQNPSQSFSSYLLRAIAAPKRVHRSLAVYQVSVPPVVHLLDAICFNFGNVSYPALCLCFSGSETADKGHLLWLNFGIYLL